MAANFTAVPVLDYSLALSPSTKPLFIKQLRNAAINVGFLYLSNTPVDGKLTEDLINFIPKMFDLPQEHKEKIRMRNSPHFLGYSKFGAELTKGKVDMREQFDIATKHECQWKDGDPDYKRLWGPSQWPDEALIPGFRSTLEQYLEQVHALADSFVTVLSESIGLGPDGLSKFYDTPELMQHRSKIVQYPVVNERSPSNQGVGPHYDAGFVTVLLQASPHEGLQVQNLRGEWIDAKPIPGTFVVNFGRALEFATQGIVRATSHRVLSPPLGSTSPRYSVPFFHNIGLDVRVSDKQYQLEFPSQILDLRDKRGQTADTDSVNFSEFGTEPSGHVNLVGRIKSHPDVAEQHYHALFKRYFPEGLPEHGSAY
ncbi:Clavaminate synthase-like protein [Hymenopellis radicata]|nr:Clavaminate synthase-like protein [Hymenopellis radicata]